MGKSARRMVKQKQKGKDREISHKIDDLKIRLQEQMDQEIYDEALGTLAELVQQHEVNAELMYRGAYCYFMTGDYKRTAEWIDNTLAYQPNHIKARILLARLCLLEERTDDGLAIFDFVLQHWADSLQSEQKSELKEILDYYARNEKQRLLKGYPYVAGFLSLQPEPAEVHTSVVDESSSVRFEKAAATETGIRDMADRLKKMLGNESDAESVSAQGNQRPNISTADSNVPLRTETIVQEILATDVSLTEKVRLFNAFAGSFYREKNDAAAQVLLTEALKIDAGDLCTLRNIAYLFLDMGKKSEALFYAGKMREADFSLLRLLRD